MIYVILTALLFTTLEPVSKLIADSVTPTTMTCLRFLIGGLMLLPFAIANMRKKGLKLTGKEGAFLVLLGVFCVCISMPLLQYSVKLGDSPALIAIIFSSNSVFTVILAAVILKERITAAKLVALACCMAGILVCFDFQSGTSMLSAVLAVAAALTFSLYTVLGKKMMAKFSGMMQTGLAFTAGSVVLLMLLPVAGGAVPQGLEIREILILLYIGIFVTGVGYWSYFKTMEKASAMSASLVFFIKPVLTPFFCVFHYRNTADGADIYRAGAGWVVCSKETESKKSDSCGTAYGKSLNILNIRKSNNSRGYDELYFCFILFAKMTWRQTNSQINVDCSGM